MKPFAAIALIFVFCVFISTACPTIYTGDSGETCATGFTLGIGHPPGYPIYTLASKIFTMIPLGDEAFRVNMLAAFSGVIAVLFIFLLAMEFLALTGAREKYTWIPALIAALGYAFSGTFWFEAVHAKGGIYTMAVMVSAAALYFGLKFYNSGKNKFMYMALYTAAFLPWIHLTASLVTIFVLLIVYIWDAGRKTVITPAAVVIFTAAFLTPVFYLIIRSFSQAEIRWADINSLGGVIGLIMRKTYYTPGDMPFSFHVLFFKLWHHILQYVKDYTVFIPFVIYGFYRVFITNIRLFYVGAGFLVLNAAAVLVLTGNSFSPVYLYVNKGFYLIADMGTMIFAAVGMYAAAMGLKKHIDPRITSGVFMILPITLLVMNFRPSNLASSYIAYDHAVNIEKTLKPGDTLLCGADTPVFNIAYMKYVKNRYEGINIYDTNANLFDLTPFRQYRGHMTEAALRSVNAQLAQSNPGRVYTSEFTAYPEINLKPESYGIINRMVEMNTPPTEPGISAIYAVRDYSQIKYADIASREITARYFISKAQEMGLKGDRQGFENYRVLAEKTCPDNPGIMSTIASAYFYGTGDMNQSVKYLEKAVLMDPYFMGAIRLLTRLYGQYNVQEARKWAEIYVEREWDKSKVEEVRKEFGI